MNVIRLFLNAYLLSSFGFSNVQYNKVDDGNARIIDTSITDFVGYLPWRRL